MQDNTKYLLIEQFGFTAIPNSVLSHRVDLGLSLDDLGFIQLLHRFIYGSKRTYSWVSNARLAVEIGCTVRTIQRKRNKFVKLGLLSVTSTPQGNIYDLSPMYDKISDILIRIKDIAVRKEESESGYEESTKKEHVAKAASYKKKRSEYITLNKELSAPKGVALSLISRNTPELSRENEYTVLKNEASPAEIPNHILQTVVTTRIDFKKNRDKNKTEEEMKKFKMLNMPKNPRKQEEKQELDVVLLNVEARLTKDKGTKKTKITNAKNRGSNRRDRAKQKLKETKPEDYNCTCIEALFRQEWDKKYKEKKTPCPSFEAKDKKLINKLLDHYGGEVVNDVLIEGLKVWGEIDKGFINTGNIKDAFRSRPNIHLFYAYRSSIFPFVLDKLSEASNTVKSSNRGYGSGPRLEDLPKEKQDFINQMFKK